MRDPQDHERVGVRSLHQLAVRPGIDRAPALEVDVRTQDAAEPRRRGDAIDGRRAGPVLAHEELLELGAQGPERRGIGTARQRRRPPSRLAVLLVEHREGRPIEDHRLIEAPDQVLQFLHRHEVAGVAQHPRLDLGQRRLAVEMPDDVGVAVERDQHRLGYHPRRILQHDENLTLVLDPSSGERPELRFALLAACRRHRLGHRWPPGSVCSAPVRSVQNASRRHQPGRHPTGVALIMLSDSPAASSTPARTTRLAGDQRQRPRGRSDLADGLRPGHRLLLSSGKPERWQSMVGIDSLPRVPPVFRKQSSCHEIWPTPHMQNLARRAGPSRRNRAQPSGLASP